MKRTILILAAFVLLSGMAVVSYGQIRYTPRHHHARNINKRERRQQRRIANGIRHGKLTARETRRLETREIRTNRMERRMRRNGLNRHERRVLNRRLNRNSRAIYRKKHNRRRVR